MNTINTMEKEDNVQKPNLVVNTSDDFGIPPPPSSPPPNATNANANSSGFTNDMKTFCNKCCLKPRDCKKRYDEDMEEYSNFKMDGSCGHFVHEYPVLMLRLDFPKITVLLCFDHVLLTYWLEVWCLGV